MTAQLSCHRGGSFASLATEDTNPDGRLPPPSYLAVTGQETGLLAPDSAAAAQTYPRPGSRASSCASSLPAYEDDPAIPVSSTSPSDFLPTTSLQIQTTGKPWLSFPAPLRPDPIPVFAVNNHNGSVTDLTPKYISLRQSRNSGNCILVSGRSAQGPALATTLYRFGPGKPPVLSLLSNRNPDSNRSLEDLFQDLDAEAKKKDDELRLTNPASELSALSPSVGASDFATTVTAPSLLSRTNRLVTPLGTFQWRYSSRSERQFFDANNVLVLERILPASGSLEAPPLVAADSSSGDLDIPDVEERGEGKVSSSGFNPLRRNHAKDDKKKKKQKQKQKQKDGEETAKLVGYFVRNEEYRTPGSSKSTAGNGGRLMLDLRDWRKGSRGAYIVDEKRAEDFGGTCSSSSSSFVGAEAEAVEKMAVVTCLVMLKKEVDRRRMHQAAIVAGASGGGS